jgi:TPR repeat protein
MSSKRTRSNDHEPIPAAVAEGNGAEVAIANSVDESGLNEDSAPSGLQPIQAAGNIDIQMVKEVAECGDPEAQYRLAETLIHDKPLPNCSDFRDSNLYLSQLLFTKAAESGHPMAQYEVGKLRLGNNYYLMDRSQSFGDEKTVTVWASDSHAEGLKLMTLAAEQGCEEAQDYLAWFFPRAYIKNHEQIRGQSIRKFCDLMGYEFPKYAYDWDQAIKWLTKKAERGNWKAANELANIYGAVLCDFERDYSKEAEWRQKAIDMGSVYSSDKRKLGCLYEAGLGVPQSIEKAIKLYNEVALHDDEAAERLEALFALGHGTQEDRRQAEKWLTEHLTSGWSGKQQRARAIRWFEKAELHDGNVRAFHGMGFVYLHGAGVRKNKKKAIACFQKAADAGLKSSQRKLEELRSA